MVKDYIYYLGLRVIIAGTYRFSFNGSKDKITLGQYKDINSRGRDKVSEYNKLLANCKNSKIEKKK
ncbi:hypothetical protein fh0823_05010 [Francisella halioticida]|nr:hypothetical protein fh0823_05010 [Francisella halioticida]